MKSLVGMNEQSPDSLAENWGWLEEEQQKELAQVWGWSQGVSSLTGSRVCSLKLRRSFNLQLVTEGL